MNNALPPGPDPHIVFMVVPVEFGLNPGTKDNTFQYRQNGQTSPVHEATPSYAKDSFAHRIVAEKAVEEVWAAIHTLEERGVKVLAVQGQQGLADEVFPNNWFSTHVVETENGPKSVAVAYPFHPHTRMGETRQDWIHALRESYDHFIDLRNFIHQGKALEGTGALIFVGNTIFANHSQRMDQEVLDELIGRLNALGPTVPFKAVTFRSYLDGQEIYHTNIVMEYGEGLLWTGMELIPDEAERNAIIRAAKELGMTLVQLSEDQVRHMAGNMKGLRAAEGPPVLLQSLTAHLALRDSEFSETILSRYREPSRMAVINIETIERVGGGSARCMVGGVSVASPEHEARVVEAFIAHCGQYVVPTRAVMDAIGIGNPTHETGFRSV